MRTHLINGAVFELRRGGRAFENSVLFENRIRLSSRPQRQQNLGPFKSLERGVEGSRRIFPGDTDPGSSSLALSRLPSFAAMLLWQKKN
jgi:hypothetical protein